MAFQIPLHSAMLIAWTMRPKTFKLEATPMAGQPVSSSRAASTSKSYGYGQIEVNVSPRTIHPVAQRKLTWAAPLHFSRNWSQKDLLYFAQRIAAFFFFFFSSGNNFKYLTETNIFSFYERLISQKTQKQRDKIRSHRRQRELVNIMKIAVSKISFPIWEPKGHASSW